MHQKLRPFLFLLFILALPAAPGQTLPAAPDAIYPLIVDLHHWESWSPYEKKDPAMQRSFSGAVAPSGVTSTSKRKVSVPATANSPR